MWLNKDSPVCTSYDWFSTPEHLGVKCQSASHGLFNVSIYQLAIIEEINKVPLKKFYIALLYSAVVVLWFCFLWTTQGGGGGGDLECSCCDVVDCTYGNCYIYSCSFIRTFVYTL